MSHVLTGNNPLLPEAVAKARLVEQLMVLKGHFEPDPVEARKILERSTLKELAELNNAILEEI